jgi:hypothetical protein
MLLPPTDICSIREAAAEAAALVLERYEEGEPGIHGQVAPLLLTQALDQLLEVLQRLESGTDDPEQPLVHSDLSQLGDYGITLLSDLATWASLLELEDARRSLEGQIFPLALWIARRGGELRSLEPVVNALAALANDTRDHARLEALSAAMAEIGDAAAPAIRQDLEKANRGRPWRLLHLNRAIVATRSHNVAAMERAFQELVQQLPEEAPAFFHEGMAQVGLDYPAPVRELMERYCRDWPMPTLH